MGPSPRHSLPIGRAPVHSTVKPSTWCLHVEETAVQAIVGSIVWAFSRLKKPRSREMSARSYALHSVRPKLSFFFFLIQDAGHTAGVLKMGRVLVSGNSRISMENVSKVSILLGLSRLLVYPSRTLNVYSLFYKMFPPCW